MQKELKEKNSIDIFTCTRWDYKSLSNETTFKLVKIAILFIEISYEK